MTQFEGTFRPPPFGSSDLDEMESRHVTEYKGVSAEDASLGQAAVLQVCQLIRADQAILRREWQRLRDWSRALPDDAQLLKTDLFRLLKAVTVGD